MKQYAFPTYIQFLWSKYFFSISHQETDKSYSSPLNDHLIIKINNKFKGFVISVFPGYLTKKNQWKPLRKRGKLFLLYTPYYLLCIIEKNIFVVIAVSSKIRFYEGWVDPISKTKDIVIYIEVLPLTWQEIVVREQMIFSKVQ